ncbi:MULTISPECIES: MFS transporter [unclassified Rhodococcus (in: high G+C Gram-positive bacteria)]|uniref:MFS transporter n=1 Tax=unclassified Rhodococcus (in: high G+C Gram-positive bacteria) TaxID=192944 RepID=UPI00163A2386|nr:MULTISPECIES: MFS transporter [unclassified Rhodococcus (in: high G+C Gram-positive bacteria)]MBC2639768.1 MFS transporter [Rhodococcus sp. 3A]MBC2895487.1 MFS transporter [Rhodococcus sp. 4CII]
MSGETGLKPLVTTVFVPAAIFGIGQGAAAPVMALTARELGASVAVSGLIVAVVGLGAVLGDLPAGRIVARFGERRSIIGGSAVGAVGVLVCLLAQTPWMLGVGALLTGLANAVWGLARQSYLADAVPIGLRARAMSSFAAMWRLGFFVGPLLGAAVILVVGARGGFLVQFVGVVLSGWLMSRVPDPPRRRAAASRHATLPSILRRHRKLLATLGAGSLLMGAARASREAVLPLWAAYLGLDAAQVSLVFGAGAAVDLLCSYPAGQFMDRYGRRFIAVPSLLVIGVSYLALPFSHDLLSIGVVAVVMGIGNGLGNGVIMTLGADIAPPATRAEFLAAWRLTHDTGMFAGPFGVGALAAVVPLGAAVAAVGGAALLGATILFRFIPIYSPWPPAATASPDSPPLEKQEA